LGSFSCIQARYDGGAPISAVFRYDDVDAPGYLFSRLWEHEVLRPRRLTFPASCLQIEKRCRLFGDGTVARKDQWSCCPGLVAASCNTRHQVLRLIRFHKSNLRFLYCSGGLAA
jgi:hypothetical protein